MKFMEASEKRHDATDSAIMEQQTFMKNQQASIHNLEVQLGQLATLVHEKLSPKNPEVKAQSHVMAIDTEEDTISEFLEALEEEPQHPKNQGSKMEKVLNQARHDVALLWPRRGACLIKNSLNPFQLISHLFHFQPELHLVYWRRSI